MRARPHPLALLLALLLPLSLLGGCGPQVDGPFTDSRIPPNLERRFLPPHGWAWGLLQIGDSPPIRYGVAAPPVRPAGDVLIVAGYGESAEAWFETANALVAKGYAVWIMDSAGQGGSGRFARPRDLGHNPDFRAEADGIRAVASLVGRPVVVIAQSTAAPSALSALAAGLPAKSLMLSAPVFSASEPPINAGAAVAGAASLSRVRLGWLRAAGQDAWSASKVRFRGRAGVIDSWAAANPDLRMGGVSYGWVFAFDRQAKGLTRERLAAIPTPVLMLRPAGDRGQARAQAICAALRACVLRSLPQGRGSLHLEGDPVYRPWSEAVEQVVSSAFPSL